MLFYSVPAAAGRAGTYPAIGPDELAVRTGLVAAGVVGAGPDRREGRGGRAEAVPRTSVGLRGTRRSAP